MTNTYALTDFDVYDEEDYDNYRRRIPNRYPGKRYAKPFFNKRRPTRYSKFSRRKAYRRPSIVKSRFKKVVRKPRIIRGRPSKIAVVRSRRPTVFRALPKRTIRKPRIVRGRLSKVVIRSRRRAVLRALPKRVIRKPIVITSRKRYSRIKRRPVLTNRVVKPKRLLKKRSNVVTKKKTPIRHLIKKTNPKVVQKPLSKFTTASVQQLTKVQVDATKKAMKSDTKTGKIIKIVAIVGAVGITGFGIYKFIQLKKRTNGHISTSK